MKKISLSFTIALFSTFCTANLVAQENVILETGHVGIGTLNPSATLDVNGNVHIDSMLLVKDSILIHKNARIKQNIVVEGNSIIKLDAFVEKELVVEGNTTLKGDVAIDGKIFYPHATNEHSFAGKTILIMDTVTGEINQIRPSTIYDMLLNEFEVEVDCTTGSGQNPHPIWSSGLNKLFTPCPEVKIGINQFAPRVELDVQGTTYSKKIAIGTLNPETSTPLLHLYTSTTSGNDVLMLIERFEKKLFQLDNQGLLKTREILIDRIDCLDYVFEKQYPLMPLQQVEQFLIKNKHLPNVPTKEFMVNTGLGLGETDKILMEKVEELTLYAIEQDKLIKELFRKLELLEKSKN